MVMVMFAVTNVEILLKKVAEVLVVPLICCWFNYQIQLSFVGHPLIEQYVMYLISQVVVLHGACG